MARPEEQQPSVVESKEASFAEDADSVDPAARAARMTSATWNSESESESEHGSESDEEEADLAAASGLALGRDKGWTREELQELWLQYDNNNSGQISLAEIKTCVEDQYPAFNNDQVLMRAYHFADEDGSGLITRPEFTLLLRALPYFSQLWTLFEEMDVDGDGSVRLIHLECRVQFNRDPHS